MWQDLQGLTTGVAAVGVSLLSGDEFVCLFGHLAVPEASIDDIQSSDVL